MATTIFENENGKITGRQDEDTKSIILTVFYAKLLPEHITVPKESIPSIVHFLKGIGFKNDFENMLLDSDKDIKTKIKISEAMVRNINSLIGDWELAKIAVLNGLAKMKEDVIEIEGSV